MSTCLTDQAGSKPFPAFEYLPGLSGSTCPSALLFPAYAALCSKSVCCCCQQPPSTIPASEAGETLSSAMHFDTSGIKSLEKCPLLPHTRRHQAHLRGESGKGSREPLGISIPVDPFSQVPAAGTRGGARWLQGGALLSNRDSTLSCHPSPTRVITPVVVSLVAGSLFAVGSFSAVGSLFSVGLLSVFGFLSAVGSLLAFGTLLALAHSRYLDRS